MIRFPFDETFEPLAPVAPLRVAHPRSSRESGIVLAALLDTGADCTCVPAGVASRLRLPIVDLADVEGVGGRRQRVPIYAAHLEIAHIRMLARIVALEADVIIGRDVLSRTIVTFDGAKRMTTFGRVPAAKKTTRRR